MNEETDKTPWTPGPYQVRNNCFCEIVDPTGHLMATVPMTAKALALLQNEGREPGEPWIDYRQRTEPDRQREVENQLVAAGFYADDFDEIAGMLMRCGDLADTALSAARGETKGEADV